MDENPTFSGLLDLRKYAEVMPDDEKTKILVTKVDAFLTAALEACKTLINSWQIVETLETELSKDVAGQKITLTNAMLALAPRCEAKVCSSCKVKDKEENKVWTECIEALLDLKKSEVKIPYLYHRNEEKNNLVRMEVCGFEKGAPVWIN